MLWHNGSNTLWYALLMLLPARNTVLAFATNEGAIQAAETAFVELARELDGSAPGSGPDPPKGSIISGGVVRSADASGDGVRSAWRQRKCALWWTFRSTTIS